MHIFKYLVEPVNTHNQRFWWALGISPFSVSCFQLPELVYDFPVDLFFFQFHTFGSCKFLFNTTSDFEPLNELNDCIRFGLLVCIRFGLLVVSLLIPFNSLALMCTQ